MEPNCREGFAEASPERIAHLEENQVFVFGSNLDGMHAGGAAYHAYKNFGAVWGRGVGLQGKSYAIPTMQGPVSTIRPYVDGFLEFAGMHPELEFLVTRIGCGIAGFRDEEIAPLFKGARGMANVHLPESFIEILTAMEEPSPSDSRVYFRWSPRASATIERMRAYPLSAEQQRRQSEHLKQLAEEAGYTEKRKKG